MKRGLLIAALFATTLSATGSTAAETARPQVGFVAYPGSQPSPFVLVATGLGAGSRQLPRARVSS